MLQFVRGLIAFFIGLVTSAVGCVLAILAGDYLTQLYHVSDMEGSRGYAVVFLCAPLGILVGFITGLVTALRSRNRWLPS